MFKTRAASMAALLLAAGCAGLTAPPAPARLDNGALVAPGGMTPSAT